MAEPLVDPRVAKHGGTRRSSKSSYEFPGMINERDWRRTSAHKAVSRYSCALCGAAFNGPHAVYAHLAKEHDR